MKVRVAHEHENPSGHLAEAQTIRLTAEESRRFVEALLEPREPTAELRAAARRYAAAIAGWAPGGGVGQGRIVSPPAVRLDLPPSGA